MRARAPPPPRRPNCDATQPWGQHVQCAPAPRRQGYDHIVVECSGSAEPRLVRRLFQDAQSAGWPLMRYLSLENMATAALRAIALYPRTYPQHPVDRRLEYSRVKSQISWARIKLCKFSREIWAIDKI